MIWWNNSIFDGCTKREAKILWVVVVFTTACGGFLFWGWIKLVDKMFTR